MLVLRTPKGWTGPNEVDGKPVEGTWRAHQVPLARLAEKPEHLRDARALDEELPARRAVRRPTARPTRSCCALVPSGTRGIGATPLANGGVLLPRSAIARLSATTRWRCRHRAPCAPRPRACSERSCATCSVENESARNFLLFGPDETDVEPADARLRGDAKRHLRPPTEVDRNLAPDGRVIEVLSEHLCQGWLEGYLLTGRHGFFSCYEAFVHIVDSMFNQHAKWLKVANELPWRRPISSLNYLLDLARLAAGSQRLQPPGPGLHRSRRQQEGRRDPRLLAARREHAALRRATTACAARNLVNVIVAGKQP